MFIVVGLLYIIHMTPFPSQDMHSTVQPGGDLSLPINSKLITHSYGMDVNCQWEWKSEKYYGAKAHRPLAQPKPKPKHISNQGWLKYTYNMGIPIFKYEKIELLVCIYEISRELVFIYGISGCSRCLTPVTIVNPILPSHLNQEILSLTTM